MTSEVIRLQYLEAMGITSWSAKFQLPNALPTQACEWEPPAAAEPPRERLHALLEDVPPVREVVHSSREAANPLPSREPKISVRALLGQSEGSKAKDEVNDLTLVNAKDSANSVTKGKAEDRANISVEAKVVNASEPLHREPSASVVESVAESAAEEPLEFSFSCLCVGERWLSIHEGEIGAAEQSLLVNMLHAIGIAESAISDVTYFRWPPLANLATSDDLLAEAQEGVAAFVSGIAGRQGWQFERLLWWPAPTQSEPSPLERVVSIRQAESRTLRLPVWQGPDLTKLTLSAQAKRAQWPHLVALKAEWLKAEQLKTTQQLKTSG